MSSARLSKLSFRRRILRPASALCRDRSGATAVEFAIVALPLVAMLFSLVELALVFLLSATLDNATAEVARTVRTGAAQVDPKNSAANMVSQICGKLGWLEGQCSTSLHVDVRTYTQFANPAAPNPIKNGSFDPTALQYDTGGTGQIVIVRAYYQWKVLTPFLNGGLQPLKDGSTLITATSAFRNEPFS